MNELQLFVQHLKHPEYVHLLLNPLPAYATGVGILALIAGLLMRSRQVQIVALIIVIVGCASAYPVLHYGQRGYDRLYEMSNIDAQQWLDLHMERAESFVYAFYATAAVAFAALMAVWRMRKLATGLAVIACVMAAVSVGIAGWIGHAGGQVRHSEFRDGPPPSPTGHAEQVPHHHQH